MFLLLKIILLFKVMLLFLKVNNQENTNYAGNINSSSS